jgi:hypothetical protein
MPFLVFEKRGVTGSMYAQIIDNGTLTSVEINMAL